MAVLKLEIKSVYKYRLINSSLTAERVRTPRSVKRKNSYILGRSVESESLGPIPLIYTKTQPTQQRGSVKKVTLVRC